MLSTEVTKEKLLQLREKTGLGLGKCRSALIDKGGDVEAAAAFLHEEAIKHGWEKMQKLSSRSTSQGLLGAIQSEENQSVTFLEVSFLVPFWLFSAKDFM